MEINFKKFIDFIVFYLEKIQSKSSDKSDIYLIPIDLIDQKHIFEINFLQYNIEELASIGLEITYNIKSIKKFKKNIPKFVDNKNDLNIKSAYEIIKNSKSEMSLKINDNKNNHNNQKANGNQKVLGINIDSVDLSKGFIHIISIPDFAIFSSKFIEIKRLLKIFNWKNFEDFVSVILEYFGYCVTTNFRFSISKHSNIKEKVISKTTKKIQKRFEIDVVAIRKNFILFIDTKYWKLNNNHNNALINAAELQAQRVRIFTLDKEALNKLLDKFSKRIKNNILNQIENNKIKKNIDNSNEIWIFPIIVYTGQILKHLRTIEYPIINFLELTDFLKDFSFISKKYQRFMIKNYYIQKELF